MKQPKHTNGQWRFNSTRTALLSFNSKNEYTLVFDLSPKNQLEPSKQDAAVIEAAPEMLEALEMAAERLRDLGQHWETPEDHELEMQIYEKAIAKARGES